MNHWEELYTRLVSHQRELIRIFDRMEVSPYWTKNGVENRADDLAELARLESKLKEVRVEKHAAGNQPTACQGETTG